MTATTVAIADNELNLEGRTMIMTNLEKFKHMLNMQKMYDGKVMRDKHIDSINPSASRLALLDEVGELNHELKGLWCWWKESQAEPNKTKVLEELIDCWHFAMNRYLTYANADDPTPFVSTAINCYTAREIFDLDKYFEYMNGVVSGDEVTSLRDLINASELLGFAFDDIYMMYLKKNSINYDRLKNNY